MKSQTEFWKNWWDDRARHSASDFDLNRATSIRVEVLEQRALRQFLEAVAPQAGDVILDAGCGSGRNISILSSLVGAITGIDYSEQMIERAKERATAEKWLNVSLMQGDVTRLPFGDHTFDKVICASVLQYLDNEACAEALHELVRVCKPGGRLVLHVKNGNSLYGLSLKLLRPVARLIGRRMKPEHYRSRAWHERVLAEVGGTRMDYDGFGIFTFVPLPQGIVASLLRFEMRIPVPKFLKKYAVNYKMTIQVDKNGFSRD